MLTNLGMNFWGGGESQKPWRDKAEKFAGQISERPRRLLLSLWMPSRPSPGSDRAPPGPILGPKGSRPDSPCALFYSVSDPSRFRGGGHPGPSWSHPGPKCSFQDRAWTSQNRLLGHFQFNSPKNSLRHLRAIFLKLARPK